LEYVLAAKVIAPGVVVWFMSFVLKVVVVVIIVFEVTP
jgi:hypothetical protein